MSDIIQLLPDSVANQIAAGEVIQRPASVVKELVENAIDAGAHTIDILIEDAGRTSIQVVDDGKGMSETDARLAFERHATSKIRSAADLFSLTTMGFRGEALPSIAAVSQVELRTRRPEDELGTRLNLSASRFTGQQPCPCPIGSNFKVENLFFNVPARRRFLKSNTTEMSNITTAFERIALVNPSTAFTLKHNGTTLHALRPAQPRQRITDIFGKKLGDNLLNVAADTSICHISGYVGKPESARRKTSEQFFFVNGRYMRHPYFARAVVSAFDRIVPEGMQVPFFIYFTVPPDSIDVNIHPTKTEIKFDNEQAVWQLLAAAVRQAVGMFHGITAIDFDNDDAPEMPVFGTTKSETPPQVHYSPTYTPFETPAERRTTSGGAWEQLYSALKQRDNREDTLFTATGDNSTDDTAGDNVATGRAAAHYQYKGRYIMTAVKSGLMAIDQHLAHVRVLYDRYLQLMRLKKPCPQQVMFPETIHFAAQEETALKSIMPQLKALGFIITDAGNHSYTVTAVPPDTAGNNPTTLLRDIIAAETERRDGTATGRVSAVIAMRLAHSTAIDYGQALSNDEMEDLVTKLFACNDYAYTPDGKRILALLQHNDIMRLFE